MQKIYNMIGLAQRAGKVSSGALAAKTSILSKRAHLLVISRDISENSSDSLLSSCEKLKIPWIILGNKYELGNSTGKAYRVALTINDANIAKAVIDTVKSSHGIISMGVVEWPK